MAEQNFKNPEVAPKKKGIFSISVGGIGTTNIAAGRVVTHRADALASPPPPRLPTAEELKFLKASQESSKKLLESLAAYVGDVDIQAQAGGFHSTSVLAQEVVYAEAQKQTPAASALPSQPPPPYNEAAIPVQPNNNNNNNNNNNLSTDNGDGDDALLPVASAAAEASPANVVRGPYCRATIEATSVSQLPSVLAALHREYRSPTAEDIANLVSDAKKGYTGGYGSKHIILTAPKK